LRGSEKDDGFKFAGEGTKEADVASATGSDDLSDFVLGEIRSGALGRNSGMREGVHTNPDTGNF
jgi:hypothetical protein